MLGSIQYNYEFCVCARVNALTKATSAMNTLFLRDAQQINEQMEEALSVKCEFGSSIG